LRKTAWVGGGLAATVIALLLVVPAFVDLAVFKRTYLPWVEETLHRSVDVGEVRLNLLPTPSIRVSNLRVSDDPAAYSGKPFFTAEQMQVRLRLWPLLSGRFEASEFVLEKPIINLLKRPDGSLDYSDVGGKKSVSGRRQQVKKKPSVDKVQQPAAVPLILPARVRIKDGQLNFDRGQKPVIINGIDLSLQELSAEQPFSYRASFDYPGLKTVSLEGQLLYHDEQSTLTLKSNLLKAQDLVLPLEGSISSLPGLPRVHLTASSDRLEAKPLFQTLAIFGFTPRDTEISGPIGLRLSVTGLPDSLFSELRGQFKDVKVDAKRALKGNLSGDIYMNLPLAGESPASQRLRGNGKLVARDGQLTNIDLIKRMEHVTGFIGLSPNERREATTFKTLEGEFNISRGVAAFSRIYLTNPQMEVTGAGTMTLN
jgi:hypothetical protein